MTLRDLIPGTTYLIRYSDSVPAHSYRGRAVFERANPPSYPEGTLEFELLDDTSSASPFGNPIHGYFNIEDVHPFKADLHGQMDDLLRLAKRFHLGEAASWLRAHYKPSVS